MLYSPETPDQGLPTSFSCRVHPFFVCGIKETVILISCDHPSCTMEMPESQPLSYQ